MNNLSPIPQINKDQVRQVFMRRDVSERTVDEYTRLSDDFLVFISGKQINKGTLNEYKRYLRERTDISTPFKAKKLTAAKMLLEELFGKDKITVKNFKQATGHKKDGINQAEMKKIAGYLKELEPSKETVRLKAIVALMYFHGLREVEIHRLNVEDLKLNDATARIKGKGADDYDLVFLHPGAVKILKAYLNYMGNKSGAVFYALDNANYGARLTERSIRRTVTKMLRECGIKKVPHGFRHYYTTRLLDILNGDVRKVMKFTRHKSIETVMIYDDRRNFKEDLPAVFKAFGTI